MMRLTLTSVLFGFLIAGGWMSPAPAAGQEPGCDECAEEWDAEFGAYYHYFGVDLGPRFACTSGDGCHLWEAWNTCDQEHSRCYLADAHWFGSALLAIRSGDPILIEELVARGEKLGRLGRSASGELVVHSCDGNRFAAVTGADP